jgi:hypothetical protein
MPTKHQQQQQPKGGKKLLKASGRRARRIKISAVLGELAPLGPFSQADRDAFFARAYAQQAARVAKQKQLKNDVQRAN